MFMDDILIFASTFQELVDRIEVVLVALERAGLKLQARKCEFGSGETTYLGHRIGAEGVASDPAKVEGMVRSVRRFLGMDGYYRHFVPQVAQVAAPLTAPLRKKRVW